MKKPPETPEFARFTSALQDILKVSKVDIERRLETQKDEGKRLSKGSSCLSPAASAKLRASFADR